MLDTPNVNGLVRGKIYCLVPTERVKKNSDWEWNEYLVRDARYVRHENLKREQERGWETFYAWDGPRLLGAEGLAREKEELVRIRVPTKAIVSVEWRTVIVDGELVTRRIVGKDNLANIQSISFSTPTVCSWIREVEGMEILDECEERLARRR